YGRRARADLPAARRARRRHGARPLERGRSARLRSPDRARNPRRDPRGPGRTRRLPRGRRSGRGQGRGPQGMNSTNGALLSIQNLDVRYASVQALFDVSVEVPEGAVVAVLGANGAGKSTLARSVSGLVPSFGGRVMFAGDDITKSQPHDIRRAALV